MDNTGTEVGKLYYDLTLNGDQFSAGVAVAKGEAASFSNQLASVGSSATSLGNTMTKDLTLPIVAVGAAAVKMATDFQQKMELVRTQAGATQQEVDAMSQSVLDLAKNSMFGPSQLADALFHVESVGYRGAAAMDVLKVATEGASLGQTDLDATTNALVGVLQSHVTGVKNASDAMAVLDAVIGQGNLRMEDLNAALGTGIAATASTFGVSLQSVGAALAEMTSEGIPATRAATQLNMVMALMSGPTQQAAKYLGAIGLAGPEVTAATDAMTQALREAGLTTTTLAADLRKPNGISVAIQDLKDHLTAAGLSADEANALITRTFGGGRTAKGVMELTQGLDGLNQKYAAINVNAGHFAGNVAAEQETANYKMHAAMATVEADLVEMGQELMPIVAQAVRSIADEVSKLTDWWNSLSEGQHKMVLETLGVIAITGPLLKIFGSFVGTLTTTVKLITGVGGLITSLARGATSMVSFGTAAAEGATAVAGVGEASVAAEVGAGGLAAALGPIALGVAAVGVVVGGGLLFWDKWKKAAKDTGDQLSTFSTQALITVPHLQEYTALAKDLGVTLEGTASQVSLLNLAQKNVKDGQTLLTAAAKGVDKAQSAYNDTLKTSAARQQDIVTAQANVRQSYDKFGALSPQYQAAVDNLAKAQWNADNALADGATKSVDLTIKKGLLFQATGNLNGAVSNLTSVQKFLNDQMEGGVGIVAKFGPTALDQVKPITVLQNTIGTLVTSWGGFTANVQNQSAGVNAILFGTSSTIQQIQGQSNALNSSLSAAQSSAQVLQGAGVNLQASHHAAGGPMAAGELSWVGEQGPELFMPNVSGTIIPNNMATSLTGSQAKTVINVDMSGILARGQSELRDIASSLIDAVNQKLKAQGKPLLGVT